ncbi:MAG: GNAT family N-acetyltransferase [Pseudomonadota bacterium]
MFDEAPLPRHSLLQDPAFEAALRACGQTPVRLESGHLILRQRVLGMPLAMLPRAAPPPDLTAQVRRAGLQRLPLILSPERPSPLPPAVPLRGACQLAVWDISGSVGTRRARLHQKWRNQLRKAEMSDLCLHEGRLPPDPADPILQAAAQHAAAHRYTLWPAPLTAAFAHAAPAQTQLFQARLNGAPVANMLFLTHGDQATYHFGQTSDKGRAHAAHNLILWRAAEALSARGIKAIDLGRVDGQSPTLDRFKLRTGAQRQKTGGTYLHWRPWA